MTGSRNDKVPKLRRLTERFLAGQPASTIPELRLPTVRSVLQYFLLFTTRVMADIPQPKRHEREQETNRPKRECVMRISAKAGIKTQLYCKVGNPVDAVEGYKQAKDQEG